MARSSFPEGDVLDSRAPSKEEKMSVSTKLALLPTARATANSFAVYLAGKFDFGSVDVETLGKIVETYFACHSEWQGSDARKAERKASSDAAKAKVAARKAEAE